MGSETCQAFHFVSWVLSPAAQELLEQQMLQHLIFLGHGTQGNKCKEIMILTIVIFTGDQSPAASILKKFILPTWISYTWWEGQGQRSSAVAPGAHFGH